MEKIYIDCFEHPLYSSFENLYTHSFPVFEQRTPEQQAQAFASANYHLTGYVENQSFMGFIAYWEFPDYLYIEHFAIDSKERGKGYGSQVLNRFVTETPKTVLLEIDPPVDEISIARLRFYQKCGFYQNPYSHIHPPYRKEYKGHSLQVLTTGGPLSPDGYEQFKKDLTQGVMNFG